VAWGLAPRWWGPPRFAGCPPPPHGRVDCSPSQKARPRIPPAAPAPAEDTHQRVNISVIHGSDQPTSDPAPALWARGPFRTVRGRPGQRRAQDRRSVYAAAPGASRPGPLVRTRAGPEPAKTPDPTRPTTQATSPAHALASGGDARVDYFGSCWGCIVKTEGAVTRRPRDGRTDERTDGQSGRGKGRWVLAAQGGTAATFSFVFSRVRSPFFPGRVGSFANQTRIRRPNNWATHSRDIEPAKPMQIPPLRRSVFTAAVSPFSGPRRLGNPAAAPFKTLGSISTQATKAQSLPASRAARAIVRAACSDTLRWGPEARPGAVFDFGGGGGDGEGGWGREGRFLGRGLGRRPLFEPRRTRAHCSRQDPQLNQ